jgi:predicted esterase
MFRFAVTTILVILTCGVVAQTDCVDYDSRYPITTTTGKQYFWNPLWNFSPMKMEKISNLNIGGDDFFNGMLQYVPAGYYNSENTSKQYPLIISFHGNAAKGNGTLLELCRLFKDRGGDSAGHKTFPGRVERNTTQLTQTYNGETYEYLVIAPQFNKYIREETGTTDQFPSAKQVENVIDFAVQRFRVDPRRIYLTGYSTGANMIIEYAGSSVARASRVAAIMPVALCSKLGHPNNTAMGVFAKNIGAAGLKTWFVYCEVDNCGGDNTYLNVSNAWVDSIMKTPGAAVPRYTRLRNVNPATLYNCSDSLLHDAWSRAFDPNFRISHQFNGGNSTSVNDGINLNMYEWFIRQTNTGLPDPPDDTTSPENPPPPDDTTSPENPPPPDDTTSPNNPPPDEPDPPLTPPGLENDDTFLTLPNVSVKLSPNPFNSRILAMITLKTPQQINIAISDITGRLIKAYSGNLLAGNSQVEFILGPNNAAGIYVMKVEGRNFRFTRKIVKR